MDLMNFEAVVSFLAVHATHFYNFLLDAEKHVYIKSPQPNPV